MSSEAVAWAMRADLTGRVVPAHRLVLITLADHAGADGAGAWPAVARIAHRIGTSERNVLRALTALERAGLIVRGDQRIVSHVPANRRPTVWNLRLGARINPAEPAEERATLPTLLPVDRGDTGVTPGPVRGDTGDMSGMVRGDSHGHSGVTPVSPKPTTELTTPTSPNYLGDPKARGRETPTPRRLASRRRPDGTCHRCDLPHVLGTECPMPTPEQSAAAAAAARARRLAEHHAAESESGPGPEDGGQP